jgi:tripartite-type tricarboxylate transporter receptor subunit TctC
VRVLYASVGAGTLPHLCALLFEQRAGLNLVHVPYPGSPQAITDVIAGRVTLFFAPASAVVGQIGSGKVTALATARSSALRDVPTMAEAGMPNFHTPLWLRRCAR